MSEEQKSIDWDAEAQKLKEGLTRNWYKPKIGQHKITFLDNGERYSYDWEGKTIEKVRFSIEVSKDGETTMYDWGVTLGATFQSLYGQIVLFGKSQGGVRAKMITLLVIGTGKEPKDVQYTVLEAVPLMEEKEKQEKSEVNKRV